MSEFAVSSEAIGAAAATVSGRVAEFESRVAALNGLVTSTIGSTWSGADAFSADYMEWFTGAQEVRAALDRISSLLASSAETYDATEGTVTKASAQSHVVNDFTVGG